VSPVIRVLSRRARRAESSSSRAVTRTPRACSSARNSFTSRCRVAMVRSEAAMRPVAAVRSRRTASRSARRTSGGGGVGMASIRAMIRATIIAIS
jgi:hypothetical protein